MTKKASGPTAGVTSSQPRHAAAVAKSATQAAQHQHRYQLGQWVAERRDDGWYIAKTWMVAAGEKPRWEGSYQYPEDAAIAIARYLCSELSNRHMARAKYHKIGIGNPYYGLPPPPKLMAKPRNGGAS